MSLKKQYLSDKPVCKVTFSLPKEVVSEAQKVHIVGEFNNWNKRATPMMKQKDRTFKATLDLKKNKEYQFRYLIDDEKWQNDYEADKYVHSTFGNCENSVVVV